MKLKKQAEGRGKRLSWDGGSMDFSTMRPAGAASRARPRRGLHECLRRGPLVAPGDYFFWNQKRKNPLTVKAVQKKRSATQRPQGSRRAATTCATHSPRTCWRRGRRSSRLGTAGLLLGGSERALRDGAKHVRQNDSGAIFLSTCLFASQLASPYDGCNLCVL